ncbi:monooxygenase family protein [Acidisoma sp.]|uniref:monooxygenase family protein n=1 Tax=Acidisoma sp. TaxID=1872115 RepID=UPI003AFF866F
MSHSTKVSVDLSPYPDLVVVYLGFRARGLSGIRRMMSLGKGFRAIEESPPDGLLRNEFVLWGWMHVGMRQYWRDLTSLEVFTRSAPHSGWWQAFARGAGGSGFWHESYRRAGGIEGIYMDMPPTGLGAFAPSRAPAGDFKTARQRLAA